MVRDVTQPSLASPRPSRGKRPRAKGKVTDDPPPKLPRSFTALEAASGVSRRSADVTTVWTMPEDETRIGDIAPPSDLAGPSTSSLFGSDGPEPEFAPAPHFVGPRGLGRRCAGTPTPASQPAVKARRTQPTPSAARPRESVSRRRSKQAPDDADSTPRPRRKSNASSGRTPRPSGKSPTDALPTAEALRAAEARRLAATPIPPERRRASSISVTHELQQRTQRWRMSLTPQQRAIIPENVYYGHHEEIEVEPGDDPLLLEEPGAKRRRMELERRRSSVKKRRTTMPKPRESVAADDTFASQVQRRIARQAGSKLRHAVVPDASDDAAAEVNAEAEAEAEAETQAEAEEQALDAPANLDSPFVPRMLGHLAGPPSPEDEDEGVDFGDYPDLPSSGSERELTPRELTPAPAERYMSLAHMSPSPTPRTQQDEREDILASEGTRMAVAEALGARMAQTAELDEDVASEPRVQTYGSRSKDVDSSTRGAVPAPRGGSARSSPGAQAGEASVTGDESAKRAHSPSPTLPAEPARSSPVPLPARSPAPLSTRAEQVEARQPSSPHQELEIDAEDVADDAEEDTRDDEDADEDGLPDTADDLPRPHQFTSPRLSVVPEEDGGDDGLDLGFMSGEDLDPEGETMDLNPEDDTVENLNAHNVTGEDLNPEDDTVEAINEDVTGEDLNLDDDTILDDTDEPPFVTPLDGSSPVHADLDASASTEADEGEDIPDVPEEEKEGSLHDVVVAYNRALGGAMQPSSPAFSPPPPVTQPSPPPAVTQQSSPPPAATQPSSPPPPAVTEPSPEDRAARQARIRDRVLGYSSPTREPAAPSAPPRTSPGSQEVDLGTSARRRRRQFAGSTPAKARLSGSLDDIEPPSPGPHPQVSGAFRLSPAHQTLRPPPSPLQVSHHAPSPSPNAAAGAPSASPQASARAPSASPQAAARAPSASPQASARAPSPSPRASARALSSSPQASPRAPPYSSPQASPRPPASHTHSPVRPPSGSAQPSNGLSPHPRPALSPFKPLPSPSPASNYSSRGFPSARASTLEQSPVIFSPRKGKGKSPERSAPSAASPARVLDYGEALQHFRDRPTPEPSFASSRVSTPSRASTPAGPSHTTQTPGLKGLTLRARTPRSMTRENSPAASHASRASPGELSPKPSPRRLSPDPRPAADDIGDGPTLDGASDVWGDDTLDITQEMDDTMGGYRYIGAEWDITRIDARPSRSPTPEERVPALRVTPAPEVENEDEERVPVLRVTPAPEDEDDADVGRYGTPARSPSSRGHTPTPRLFLSSGARNTSLAPRGPSVDRTPTQAARSPARRSASLTPTPQPRSLDHAQAPRSPWVAAVHAPSRDASATPRHGPPSSGMSQRAAEQTPSQRDTVLPSASQRAASDQRSPAQRTVSEQRTPSGDVSEHLTPLQRAASEQLTPARRAASEQRSPSQRALSEQRTASQRVLSEQPSPSQRALSEQRTPLQRLVSERLTPSQRDALELPSASQRAASEQLTPLQRPASAQHTPSQRALSEQRTPSQRDALELPLASHRAASEQRSPTIATRGHLTTAGSYTTQPCLSPAPQRTPSQASPRAHSSAGSDAGILSAKPSRQSRSPAPKPEWEADTVPVQNPPKVITAPLTSPRRQSVLETLQSPSQSPQLPPSPAVQPEPSPRRSARLSRSPSAHQEEPAQSPRSAQPTPVTETQPRRTTRPSRIPRPKAQVSPVQRTSDWPPVDHARQKWAHEVDADVPTQAAPSEVVEPVQPVSPQPPAPVAGPSRQRLHERYPIPAHCVEEGLVHFVVHERVIDVTLVKDESDEEASAEGATVEDSRDDEPAPRHEDEQDRNLKAEYLSEDEFPPMDGSGGMAYEEEEESGIPYAEEDEVGHTAEVSHDSAHDMDVSHDAFANDRTVDAEYSLGSQQMGDESLDNQPVIGGESLEEHHHDLNDSLEHHHGLDESLENEHSHENQPMAGDDSLEHQHYGMNNSLENDHSRESNDMGRHRVLDDSLDDGLENSDSRVEYDNEPYDEVAVVPGEHHCGLTDNSTDDEGGGDDPREDEHEHDGHEQDQLEREHEHEHERGNEHEHDYDQLYGHAHNDNDAPSPPARVPRVSTPHAASPASSHRTPNTAAQRQMPGSRSSAPSPATPGRASSHATPSQRTPSGTRATSGGRMPSHRTPSGRTPSAGTSTTTPAVTSEPQPSLGRESHDYSALGLLGGAAALSTLRQTGPPHGSQSLPSTTPQVAPPSSRSNLSGTPLLPPPAFRGQSTTPNIPQRPVSTTPAVPPPRRTYTQPAQVAHAPTVPRQRSPPRSAPQPPHRSAPPPQPAQPVSRSAPQTAPHETQAQGSSKSFDVAGAGAATSLQGAHQPSSTPARRTQALRSQRPNNTQHGATAEPQHDLTPTEPARGTRYEPRRNTLVNELHQQPRHVPEAYRPARPSALSRQVVPSAESTPESRGGLRHSRSLPEPRSLHDELAQSQRDDERTYDRQQRARPAQSDAFEDDSLEEIAAQQTPGPSGTSHFDSPAPPVPGGWTRTPRALPSSARSVNRGARSWTTSDWRRLESFYDAERSRAATWTPFTRSRQWSVGRVVDNFITRLGLEERELVGEWSREDLELRVRALDNAAQYRERVRSLRRSQRGVEERQEPPSTLRRVVDWALGRSTSAPAPPPQAPRRRERTDPEMGFLRRVDESFDPDVTIATTPSQPARANPRREAASRREQRTHDSSYERWAAEDEREQPEEHRRLQPHERERRALSRPRSRSHLGNVDRVLREHGSAGRRSADEPTTYYPDTTYDDANRSISPQPTEIEDESYRYNASSPRLYNLYPPLPERSAALAHAQPRAIGSRSRPRAATLPSPMRARAGTHAAGAFTIHASADVSYESARRARERESVAALRRVRSEVERLRAAGHDISDESFESFRAFNEELNASSDF
ncbi:unnamed protein product [Cutaneotrichosporon oleaginosum]